MTPYEVSGNTTPNIPERPTTNATVDERKDQVKMISFDDYHALWKGIATSITGHKKTNLDCKFLAYGHMNFLVT